MLILWINYIYCTKFKMQKNNIYTFSEFKKILDELFKLVDFNKKKLFILLNGEIGTGKTTVARYIGWKIFKIKNFGKSPTFDIYKVYKKKEIHILHADFYRLDNQKEIQNLLSSFLETNANIYIFEWLQIKNIDITYLINHDYYLIINLEYFKNESQRKIEINTNLC